MDIANAAIVAFRRRVCDNLPVAKPCQTPL